MLPGVRQASCEGVDMDEQQLARTRGHHPLHDARRSGPIPTCINPSRKKRIAAGCGMKVEDVNRLLEPVPSRRVS